MAAGFNESKKKKTTKGKRLLVAKETRHWTESLSGRKFQNKALSNYAIINIVKRMGINQFMGVFFRDQISDKQRIG